MDLISGISGYIIPFLVILTVLVFVHEMGHYLIARRNGVRVEVFSVGFGRELFGWTDKAGTRWKFSLIPLGGYVKMFGDANAASMPDGSLRELTDAEREVAFHSKRLGQRAWIVAGGPLANFLFAIVLLCGLFMTIGQPTTSAVVGRIADDSVALKVGFQQGDQIAAIDGESIERFEQVQQIVMTSPEKPLTFSLLRDGSEIEIQATPERVIEDDGLGHKIEIGDLGLLPSTPAQIGAVVPESAADEAGFLGGDIIVQIDDSPIDSFEQVQEIVRAAPERTLQVLVVRDSGEVALEVTPRRVTSTDAQGNDIEIGQLGVQAQGRVEYVRHGPVEAAWRSVTETANLTVATLGAVREIVLGERSAKELGGPIRIAEMSGRVVEFGLFSIIWFMAVLSINLGLINLFPIPMLDGGHLLFYAIEALRGKPLGDRAQEYGFRIGLALVLSLIVFVTWNDIIGIYERY